MNGLENYFRENKERNTTTLTHARWRSMIGLGKRGRRNAEEKKRFDDSSEKQTLAPRRKRRTKKMNEVRVCRIFVEIYVVVGALRRVRSPR